MTRAGLLAVFGLVALLAGLLEISVSQRVNPLVPRAEATARAIAVSTAGVYVSLRAVNAVLSTAQEVDVGVSVAAQASV